MTLNDLICYPLRPNTGFRRHSPSQFTFKQEQQKKAQLNPKEKRKLKKEKKK
jgi:hypothetical protein